MFSDIFDHSQGHGRFSWHGQCVLNENLMKEAIHGASVVAVSPYSKLKSVNQDAIHGSFYSSHFTMRRVVKAVWLPNE